VTTRCVSGRQVGYWQALKVSLPTSAALFPAGKGSEIANANCLICHSAGMALRQPPLTVDEWRAEITKMKAAFGAPIPADQIGELADYLGTVDGRAGASQPGALDSQGN
jgi:mono/diheme cytochrome c family protein